MGVRTQDERILDVCSDDESDEDDESEDADPEVTQHQKEVEANKRLELFLNDPKRAVAIFLSSYALQEGLLWYAIYFSGGLR